MFCGVVPKNKQLFLCLRYKIALSPIFEKIDHFQFKRKITIFSTQINIVSTFFTNFTMISIIKKFSGKIRSKTLDNIIFKTTF